MTLPHGFCIRRLPAALIAAALLWPGWSYAADVVMLRSGFAVTCVAHQQVTPQTLRLYLPGERGATQDGNNYMDVPLLSVASVEPLPEPPGSVPPAAAQVHAAVAHLGEPLATLLLRSGTAHNVNTALLASVVQAESAGNARAVSHTGARGLMQLMPRTAGELHVDDSFAPAANVNGGTAYLAQLLTRYHDDVVLALAAYNAGPAAVDRFRGVPPFRETRLYVARVIREFNRLTAAETARGLHPDQ